MRWFRVLVCCGVVLAAVVGASIYFWNPTTYAWNPKSTKYCRVRFGSGPATEVIVGRTTDALLLFRSGNIHEPPERYPFENGSLSAEVSIPPIVASDGCSYEITSVSEYNDTDVSPRHALMIHAAIDGDTKFSQYCDVELNNSIDDLSYAHFDGPLTVGPVTINWEVPPPKPFVIGGEPADVRAVVATLDSSGGCWTVAETGSDKFPSGIHPTVTVTFPTADAAKRLVQTYPLDAFC